MAKATGAGRTTVTKLSTEGTGSASQGSSSKYNQMSSKRAYPSSDHGSGSVNPGGSMGMTVLAPKVGKRSYAK